MSTLADTTRASLDHDAEGEYHVYELRTRKRRVEAKAGISPTVTELLPHRVAQCYAESLADCLLTLHEEGQLTEDSVVGILYRPEGQTLGTWICNPWAKGRTA